MKKSPTRHGLLQPQGGPRKRRHAVHHNVLYTTGVEAAAEGRDLRWLIDVIACGVSPSNLRLLTYACPAAAVLNVWTLAIRDDGATTLTARADAEGEPFLTRRIPWLESPTGVVDIWAEFDGEHWTLCLPHEY